MTIMLITLTGQHKPEQMANIMAILAQDTIAILDIEQTLIHNLLSCGLLLELSPPMDSSIIEQTVIPQLQALALTTDCAVIPLAQYQQWATLHQQTHHRITVLAPHISTSPMAKIITIIHQHHLIIDRIERLSSHFSHTHEDSPSLNHLAIQISVRGNLAHPSPCRQALLALTNDFAIDIAIQTDDLYRCHRRLAVFDMDSTLISIEVIDELAKMAGVGDQVARITERAMRGEINFKESFTERVALLKGLPASALDTLATSLPLTDGAATLLTTLKTLGYKTAIISGGFINCGRALQKQLNIDYVFANDVEVHDHQLTGRVKGPIVDSEHKATLLRNIAHQEGLSLAQTIAVGDGANDLPMLSIAGLGIAFRAKPLVKAQASHAISTLGLDSILYLLGLSERNYLTQ